MIVYSNSCSFGAPGQGHKTYSDYVASAYSATLINRGIPGSCNRRIIRTTLRDLVELKNTDKKILALIGLTFISRTELWQPWISAVDNDGHFSSIQIAHNKINWGGKGLIETIVPNVHKLSDSRVQEYYKNWLLHFHPESAVTELLADIIMFCGWADSKKIQYLIFSNVDVLPGDDKVGYDSPFIQTLREEIISNKFIINPWTFSFGGYSLEQGLLPKDYHLYNKHGHPGEHAHKQFSEFLLENLKHL